jgi:desulfoferrodoxin (superoxide reductase-like protein)
MFFRDTDQHHLPHIHAEYQGDVAVFAIETGKILAGTMPKSKIKLVDAWIEIHRDELMADWQLASNGQSVFKIKGLDA